MSFLVMEGDEVEYIWETICQMQLVFHPKYSPDGALSYNELFELKHNKQIIVLLDRNLLSGLLKLARDGYLKDDIEMRKIALLMTWIIMNNFSASAGLALLEYGTKINDSVEPKKELQEFNNIFDYYPSMLWLRLAEGDINSIPICSLPVDPYINEINYNKEDHHLLMHIAEMLHLVFLHKQRDLSPIEKMIKFLKWNYKNLLISESTIAYVAMLFTNQPGIKAPKNSGSNDINKIIVGCKNQAWDLNYLSNWSCFHYTEENMDEIFMFATNDVLLKTIFINTYGDGGVGALIQTVFSRSDSKKIFELIKENQGTNRVKPDFGVDPNHYFHRLIEDETLRLKKAMQV